MSRLILPSCFLLLAATAASSFGLDAGVAAAVSQADGWVLAEVDTGGALRIRFDTEATPITHIPKAGTRADWPALASTVNSVVLAWVEGNASGSRIMFGSIADGALAETVQVSAGAARWSRFPSVAIAPSGDIWVAWVDGSMETDRIQVVHGRGGRFEAPETVGATDDTEDLVPQIGFDREGTPTVVWAGFDGQDDEILFSRRIDGAWTPESRIHPDNPFPDITPWMARDDSGRLHVAWSGFDGESYQVFWSEWTSDRWSAPVRVSPGTGAATLPRVIPSGAEAVVLYDYHEPRSSAVGAVVVGGESPRRLQVPAAAASADRPLAVAHAGRVQLLQSEGGSWRTLELRPTDVR